jgi:hypothetical protein
LRQLAADALTAICSDNLTTKSAHRTTMLMVTSTCGYGRAPTVHELQSLYARYLDF